MVLDTYLFNTQQYKVRIKGKVEQSREKSSVRDLGVVAIEKGAFWLPSTTVSFNFLCKFKKKKRWKSWRKRNQYGHIFSKKQK